METIGKASVAGSSPALWLFCALMLLGQSLFASDWREPEAQLAEKIAHTVGQAVISLEVNNRSSIGTADLEEIRRGLIALLAARGVRVWQADQAAARVRITFSENLENYVLVAEIRQGSGDASVGLVSLPRPESTPPAENPTPLRLEASALISRRAPILDAAVVDGRPQRLIVLGPNEVAVHEFREGRWVALQSLPIHSPTPLPRDLRGRIILRKDHIFDAYLPGLVCRAMNSPALGMTCSPSDDPWPLEGADVGLSAFFPPARNFFAGALVPGIGKQPTAPPFYCAARIPRPNYTLWLFSGVDGQVHLLDGINHETIGLSWGSDIAGIHAACRADRQVLATSAATEGPDSVEAFALSDGKPVSVSQKLSLAGMVTALWTTENGDFVTAVYRNLETGNYEAVELKLACSH